MKSFDEMLAPIKKALLSVSNNVGHFEANNANVTHIVYAEDAEGSSVSANNIKECRSIQGSIDLYALPKDLSIADEIEKALNNEDIYFSLETVTPYESDTKVFIHYEWSFEVT